MIATVVSLTGLLVGALLAALTYFVLAWLRAPQVIAALAAALVFVLIFFGGVTVTE